MDNREYNAFKQIVASVNIVSSSPYPVAIRPMRDDDGLHALVTLNECNRVAYHLFSDVLRFTRFPVHIEDVSPIHKFYFV